MTDHQVQSILRAIEAAVTARQALRIAGSGLAALEENRLRIVRLQQDLSQALLALYARSPVQKAA